MDIIAPILCGGIGNRLFQFACSYAYSKKYKKELVFLLSKCKETNHGSFENIFLLFPEVNIRQDNPYAYEIKEKDIYIYEELNDISGNIIIHGHRQCYKYFENVELRPNFLNAIPADRIAYLNEKYLKDKSNLFFVHIRLGDFRVLTHHQINLEKYYSEAFKYIPHNTELLFFSDELESAKKMFPSQNFCEEKDELESLYLMSNCLKGSIIANSTFSYWGSYFAHLNNPKHIAIFPTPLGKDLPYPTDYYPPYGITISAL